MLIDVGGSNTQIYVFKGLKTDGGGANPKMPRRFFLEKENVFIFAWRLSSTIHVFYFAFAILFIIRFSTL